jgi:hypothetical protein
MQDIPMKPDTRAPFFETEQEFQNRVDAYWLSLKGKIEVRRQ